VGLCLLAFGMSAEAASRVDRHGDPLPDGAIARLGTIRQRVVASQIAVSADGRTLITVAAGRALSRWDAVTGRMREHRLLFGKPARLFWLSPDGRLLAVNEGKSLAVFDTESGVRKCLLAVSALRVAFRRDGKMLATGEYEKSRGRVRLWDLASGKDRLLAELPESVKVWVLTFSPDGKRLFVAANDPSLCCWELDSGKQLWKNGLGADHLTISPDGCTLCSDTSSGQDLRLWDAGSGRRIGGGSTGKNVWSLGRLALDSRTVFLTDHEDVMLWDVASGKVRRRLAGAGSSFALAPDGKTLVSISGSLLRRWDVETGKPLYPDTSSHGHTGAVCGVVFAPNGRGLVTAGSDETIRFWELSTQRPRVLLTGTSYRGLPLAITPDSGRHVYLPPFLAVTTDNRRLFSDANGGQLRLTDIQTGEEVRRFDIRVLDNKKKVFVGAARLSTDGRTLWAFTEHSLDIFPGDSFPKKKETLIGWDAATGRQLSAHAIECLSEVWGSLIAPDGRTMALGDGSIRDVASGRERLKRPEPSLRFPFAFSADSRLMAAAMADHTFAVYELLTGRPLLRVEASVSWSSHLAFSPDGRLLIASGRDALHVWEVNTGRRLLHLPGEGRLLTPGPELFATCLAIAADGRSAATGHEDGTVLIWDLTAAWRRLAERPLADLTAEKLDTCWPDLLKDDPRIAYAAMDRLIAAPAKTLPFLRKHLRPVTIDSQWWADRLADLDSSDFATREKASRDLTAIAEVVEPRLRQAMGKGASLELRWRLQAIVEASHSLVPSAEAVRRLRAVAVLERLATAEARALLQELATGEPAARLTVAAKSALARMAARPHAQVEKEIP
jgi:WD40 repeat protein